VQKGGERAEYESPEIIATHVEDELVDEAAVCTQYRTIIAIG
jgi:hypothetical protein